MQLDDSMCLSQNKHASIGLMLNLYNLSAIANLSWISSHTMKLCLGVSLGNHISFLHGTFGPQVWTTFHADLVENSLDAVSFHSTPSSANRLAGCSLGIIEAIFFKKGLKHLIHWSSSSPTKVLQMLESQNSCTVIFGDNSNFKIISSPSIEVRGPVGNHSSYQKEILLPSPTCHATRVQVRCLRLAPCAKSRSTLWVGLPTKNLFL